MLINPRGVVAALLICTSVMVYGMERWTSTSSFKKTQRNRDSSKKRVQITEHSDALRKRLSTADKIEVLVAKIRQDEDWQNDSNLKLFDDAQAKGLRVAVNKRGDHFDTMDRALIYVNKVSNGKNVRPTGSSSFHEL